MKFNYIVGNPPYQYPKSEDGSYNDGKKLWKDISNRILSKYINEMIFVTPHSASHFLKGIRETTLIDYTTDRYFNVGVKIISWKVESQPLNQSSKIPKIISVDGEVEYNRDLCDNKDRVGKSLFSKRFPPSAYEKLFLLTKVKSPGVYEVYNNYLKNEKVNVTLPELYKKKKLVMSVSTSHKLDNILVTDKDFAKLFVQIDVSKMTDTQIMNIKEFLMNPLIKLFCDKYKELYGTGFNRGLNCLPKININKKYNTMDIIHLMRLSKEELEWMETK